MILCPQFEYNHHAQRDLTMKKLFALIVLSSSLLLASSLGERKQKCSDLVNKALAHVAKVGIDAAFKDFSDPKGAFSDGPYYIFAYDFSGTCLAHGQMKERVGKNFLDATDPNGVRYIVEHIKVAKTGSGEGFDVYSFRNPATKGVERKTSFIKRIPGTAQLVGCGTYLD